MPRLDVLNTDLEQKRLPTGNYSFSHTRLDDLGSTKYTLATIVVDVSGSTAGFRDEMERCLKEVVRACRKSPESDNLMLRVVVFATRLKEIHGFKLLPNINDGDYDNVLQTCHNIGGSTALFDACVNGAEAAAKFAEDLVKQEYDTNGFLACITDGDNNEGVFTAANVGQKFKDAVKKELLESLMTILVGINVTDPVYKKALKDFAKEAEFNQYVDAGSATADTLARLAAFISKSISSQSSALTTGGPSKNLTF